jgi:hypothetical protein
MSFVLTVSEPDFYKEGGNRSAISSWPGVRDMTTITRYSSHSVATSLAIQNVATTDSARGHHPSLVRWKRWDQIQTAYPLTGHRCVVSSYETGISIFYTTFKTAHWRPDGGPPHNGCRGIFVLQLPIANSISCRDRRIPADTWCPVSIRQIVAQTMQAGAPNQLSTEKGAIAVSFRAIPKEYAMLCAKYGYGEGLN